MSWTKENDILTETELHRVPSSIIKIDLSDHKEMQDKEEEYESLLIDFKSDSK